jgi:subtilisin family serine protease
MLGSSTVRWPGLLLLAVLALLSPREVQAQTALAAELAPALSAGIVDAEVVETIQRARRARVIVYVSRRGREARRQANAVIEKLSAAELKVGRRFERVPAFAGSVTASGLMRLARNPDVLRVSLDTPVRIQLGQAVPLVRIDTLHERGLEGAGRKLAVIDTGVDLDHPELEDRIVAQQCFCQGDDGIGGDGCCPNGLDTQSGPGAAEDDHGHGTRVTGVAASAGVPPEFVPPKGCAPEVAIVAVRVLDGSGDGVTSDVIAGLDWIAANHPDTDAVNLSLGGDEYEGDCDGEDADTMAYADSIDELEANGTVTVAASGNNGWSNAMLSPACIAKAVSVGAVYDSDVGSRTNFGCTDATTQADQVTCWSNASTTTDVFAPGIPMYTSTKGGGRSTGAGTSYASPMVAGCAALLRDAQPRASAAAIARALVQSPTTVVDTSSGRSYPRLDCVKAVDFVSPGVPALPAGPTASGVLALLLAAAGFGLLRSRSERASRSGKGAQASGPATESKR